MCTAISFKSKDHYFGRNLDLEYTYEEQVTVTPRNYEFTFRKKESVKNHYAIIGGTACDLLMTEEGLDFRGTKDIDLVLVVEAIKFLILLL